MKTVMVLMLLALAGGVCVVGALVWFLGLLFPGMRVLPAWMYRREK